MPIPRTIPIAVLSLAAMVSPAFADDPPAKPPAAPEGQAEEPAVVEARADFRRGAGHVEKGEWAEALSAFEKSNAARRHPVTTFNIGVCQRALGLYTRARQTFAHSLDESSSAGGAQLSSELIGQITAFNEEIDRLLVTVTIKLEPADAAIAIDGRPLQKVERSASRPTLLAGVRSPGRGERPPAAHFDVQMDPGAHVFTLSRKGFGDAIINKTFKPGAAEPLTLALDKLPATLKIASNRDGAVITVDGDDVGTTPKTVERPGGAYVVAVKKKGFVAYSTRVTVAAGESVNIKANLPEDKPGLHERWWFWGGIGALVTGAVVVTYAVSTTPSNPERPPLNGGNLGWSVDLR